jgi:hypothetical protein
MNPTDTCRQASWPAIFGTPCSPEYSYDKQREGRTIADPEERKGTVIRCGNLDKNAGIFYF